MINMEKETEYAERLIEQHSTLTAQLSDYNRDISIHCAIIDVENTIEALNEIDIQLALLEFYQTVLQILKDKL